jgi:ATP-dependent RNA helicase DeaD
MEQLDGMSREQLVKNFVSLEFNRFLDYYKDAEDLNIPDKPRKDRKDRKSKAECTRLKLNVGERDGYSPKRVLGLINDTTNDKNINIHDLEITSSYSFFDVENEDVPRLFNAFEDVYADGSIVLAEVKGDRKKDGDRRERRERERDRKRGRERDRGRGGRGERREDKKGGFRGKNSDSGKEWRTRRDEGFSRKDKGNRKNKDSFKRGK